MRRTRHPGTAAAARAKRGSASHQGATSQASIPSSRRRCLRSSAHAASVSGSEERKHTAASSSFSSTMVSPKTPKNVSSSSSPSLRRHQRNDMPESNVGAHRNERGPVRSRTCHSLQALSVAICTPRVVRFGFVVVVVVAGRIKSDLTLLRETCSVSCSPVLVSQIRIDWLIFARRGSRYRSSD